MIDPKQLIGHTRCGRYAIRADRGKGCDGWLFVAERLSQNPYAALPADFGGGNLADQGPTRVILEIIEDGPIPDQEELQALKRLHPHAYLLDCLQAGQCPDRDLHGCCYIVTESWKETLAQVLARRSVLEDDEIRKLAVCIAAALARYHAAGRAHGDVRAERICRTVDGQWKLAPLFRRNTNGAGTSKRPGGTPQDDVHALGLVLLRCLFPRPASPKEQNPPRPGSKITIPDSLARLPRFWRTLLERCLAAKPSERCSAAEIALMDSDLPPNVTSVSIEREGDNYRVSWEPPSKGTVHVYRWSRGKCPLPGETWLKADLRSAADTVSSSDGTSWISLHLPGNCHLIVANVMGEAAIVSDCIPLAAAADVQHLELTVEKNEIVATWDWPADAFVAIVVTRMGAFPTGPEDSQARAERCYRAGYMAEGCLRIPVDQAGVIHVTVYAEYPHEDGWERATGRTSGARAAIPFAPRNPSEERRIKRKGRWFTSPRIRHD